MAKHTRTLTITVHFTRGTPDDEMNDEIQAIEKVTNHAVNRWAATYGSPIIKWDMEILAPLPAKG
jgi:hypothetical protein